MTLEEFAAVVRGRIPTAGEFLAAAEGQGWKVVVRPDGTAALRVGDAKDELAVAMARMLGREPYRTRVLEAVRAREPKPPPEGPRREWLWRGGHHYVEDGHEARFGDGAWHPAGAFWWRWKGESEWRPVPGRPVAGDPGEAEARRDERRPGGVAGAGGRAGEPGAPGPPAGRGPAG